jgi:hypothetical protein
MLNWFWKKKQQNQNSHLILKSQPHYSALIDANNNICEVQ